MFFIAGAEDPVGPYGKGVQKCADTFVSVGMTDVKTKIYPLCRHEIHNEINRREVYEDVANWIGKMI